jgi:hypothetical protein
VLVALPASARADDLTVYSSLPLDTPERAIYEDIVRGEQPALEQAGGRAGLHTVRLVSLNDASNASGFWDPDRTAHDVRRAAQDGDRDRRRSGVERQGDRGADREARGRGRGDGREARVHPLGCLATRPDHPAAQAAADERAALRLTDSA